MFLQKLCVHGVVKRPLFLGFIAFSLTSFLKILFPPPPFPPCWNIHLLLTFVYLKLEGLVFQLFFKFLVLVEIGTF